MPLSPVPSPLMSMPRSVTLSLAPAFTMMPLVPGTTTPAVTPSQAIVIAFVIVTAPKRPGSRQLISPPAAVFEIAPANVLHGAVRLHGLASSPTPETQVRLAWACIITEPSANRPTTASKRIAFIVSPRDADLTREWLGVERILCQGAVFRKTIFG